MDVLNRLFKFDLVFCLCCLLAASISPFGIDSAHAQVEKQQQVQDDPYEGKDCVVVLYTGRFKNKNGDWVYWCPPCQAFHDTWHTLSGEFSECARTQVVTKSVRTLPKGVSAVPEIHVWTRKCDGSGWTVKKIRGGSFIGPPPSFMPFNLDPIRDAVEECKNACEDDDDDLPNTEEQCSTEVLPGTSGPNPHCQRI